MSMKRVQYLVGAAGLAPAAFGVAAWPAAPAAAGAPQAAAPHAGVALRAGGQAKTVSLHHAGAVTPDASCTGKTEVNMKAVGNLRGHFWYTYDAVDVNGTFEAGTCIGTIVASMHFNKDLCKTVSVRVSQAAASRFKNICGTAGHWYHMSWGLHRNIPSRPISVCENSTFHSFYVCTKT
jgi:hypothetical protein